MKLISDTLRDALIEQWSHEVKNSHIYLNVESFLSGKGLDNLAKIFEEQHSEEQGHAKIIFDLLKDLNVVVTIPTVESLQKNMSNIMDVAELYLEREISTTQSLISLKDLAIEDGNGIVEEVMRNMISKQQVEYAEATLFMDRASICGNDWKAVFMWDIGIG